MPALARLIDRLASRTLDEGTDHFDPSTLAVTTFDTGNPATNVIPAKCSAAVNIRFNDSHSSADLTRWIEGEGKAASDAFDVEIDLRIKVSGESFLTPPGPLSDLISDAIEGETGIRPEQSTSGGTSAARFIKSHCPVVEFGLVGRTMHQVDERVAVADIPRLKTIYRRILDGYFS